MSFWVGFAKAQGMGAKVAVVRDLVWGTDMSCGGPAGISGGYYEYTSGTAIVVKIAELAKVDLAILDLLSNALGDPIITPQAVTYSGNTFGMRLLGGTARLSGVAISGVIQVKAMIIGEAKRATFI